MYRLLIIIAFLIVSNVTAQKIGIKASVGSSWFGIKDKSETSQYVDGTSGLCWSAGLATEFKLTKFIYLNPEILFSKTSSAYVYSIKYSIPGGSPGEEYYFYDHVKINQVQFPLNIKIKLGKVYFMVAPSYSILFGNKNLIHRKGSSYSSYYKFDKDDLAIVNSLGVSVSKSVNLELRHYRGFAKLDDKGYHQSFISIGMTLMLNHSSRSLDSVTGVR